MLPNQNNQSNNTDSSNNQWNYQFPMMMNPYMMLNMNQNLQKYIKVYAQ